MKKMRKKKKRRYIALILSIVMILVNGVSFLEHRVHAAGGTNLLQGLPYSSEQSGNISYPDPNKMKLTDGITGTRRYSDGLWVGFHRNEAPEVSLTWDLGEPCSVNMVEAEMLFDPNAGIAFPKQVTFESSLDGESWEELSVVLSKKSPDEDEIRPMIQTFSYDASKEGVKGHKDLSVDHAYLQYLRVSFGTKQSSWTFISEVKAWGVEEKLPTAGVPNDPESVDEDESDWPGYLAPGGHSAGASDIVLLYNQANLGDTWTEPNNIIPYLAYVDEEGIIQDRFFDGVLYLAINTPSGRKLYSNENPANKTDWDWYLDKTFALKGDMASLNQAALKVQSELGDGYQVPVFLMVPYPSSAQTSFGEVNGTSLNFNHTEVAEEEAIENRKKAVEWYMTEAYSRFSSEGYAGLRFGGFYWMNEEILKTIPGEYEVVEAVSSKAHDLGTNFIWIPYKTANGVGDWEELGMDAAIFQPNHMFRGKVGDYSELDETAKRARKYHGGIEFEISQGAAVAGDSGQNTRNLYFDYLNHALINGYDQNVLQAYYQDGTTYLAASQSKDPDVREIYDVTYDYVKGNYTGRKAKSLTGPNLLTQDIVTLEAETIVNQDAWQQIQASAPETITDGKRAEGGWSDVAQVNERTSAAGPYTLKANLQQPYLIDGISLSMIEFLPDGIGAPEDVIFEISSDGETWDALGTVDKSDAIPTTSGNYTFYDYVLNFVVPVEGQYLRARYSSLPNEDGTENIAWSGLDEWIATGTKTQIPLEGSSLLTEPKQITLDCDGVINEQAWEALKKNAPKELVSTDPLDHNYDDTTAVNFSTQIKSPLIVTGDLLASSTIDMVSFNLYDLIDYGICAPDQVVFESSEDGETWKELGTVRRAGLPSEPHGLEVHYAYTLDLREKNETARYVRAIIEPAVKDDSGDEIYNWVGFQRFRVMGEQGEIPEPPAAENVLKPEMVSLIPDEVKNEEAWQNITDTAPDILTNGVIDAGHWESSEVLKLNYGHATSPYTLRANLGAVYSIDELFLNAVDYTGAGVYAPPTVTYRISMDGETWTDLGTIEREDPTTENYNNISYSLSLDEPVEAWYVEAIFENYPNPDNPWSGLFGWIGLTEIEVKGTFVSSEPIEPLADTAELEVTVETVQDIDQTEYDEYTVRALNSMLDEAAALIDSPGTDQAEIDALTKRLSNVEAKLMPKGENILSGIPVQPGDMKELTDGKRGLYWSGQPVYMLNARNTEPPFVLSADLGENYDLSWIGLDASSEPASGIHYPAEVIFEISEDGETWEELGSVKEDEVLTRSAGTISHATYSLPIENANGRYLRATLEPQKAEDGTPYTWLCIQELSALGSVSESTPTESVPEPTESEPEPTESESEPTESESEPTESEIEPTESEIEPTESETNPSEEETEPSDPVKLNKLMVEIWVQQKLDETDRKEVTQDALESELTNESSEMAQSESAESIREEDEQTEVATELPDDEESTESTESNESAESSDLNDETEFSESSSDPSHLDTNEETSEGSDSESSTETEIETKAQTETKAQEEMTINEDSTREEAEEVSDDDPVLFTKLPILLNADLPVEAQEGTDQPKQSYVMVKRFELEGKPGEDASNEVTSQVLQYALSENLFATHNLSLIEQNGSVKSYDNINFPSDLDLSKTVKYYFDEKDDESVGDKIAADTNDEVRIFTPEGSVEDTWNLVVKDTVTDSSTQTDGSIETRYLIDVYFEDENQEKVQIQGPVYLRLSIPKEVGEDYEFGYIDEYTGEFVEIDAYEDATSQGRFVSFWIENLELFAFSSVETSQEPSEEETSSTTVPDPTETSEQTPQPIDPTVTDESSTTSESDQTEPTKSSTTSSESEQDETTVTVKPTSTTTGGGVGPGKPTQNGGSSDSGSSAITATGEKMVGYGLGLIALAGAAILLLRRRELMD